MVPCCLRGLVQLRCGCFSRSFRWRLLLEGRYFPLDGGCFPLEGGCFPLEGLDKGCLGSLNGPKVNDGKWFTSGSGGGDQQPLVVVLCLDNLVVGRPVQHRVEGLTGLSRVGQLEQFPVLVGLALRRRHFLLVVLSR